ncbi:NAD-dependent epimerase/dehydratase family protein [Clostridium transplantifaecale]|uniref:NAD-dependent epimerase/dehydratase family protein n=1 Tax=Clostridium transplantifaecale TaxID=2479838 RepID=UPI000F62F906|nr:NAD-dependent epimerase/dehydratase family protein [Clostridium transplantifaecale]
MIRFMQNIEYVKKLDLPWEKLKGKTVLVSGASGLIGSFLVRVLLEKNEQIKVVALGRNMVTAKNVFFEYWDSKYFTFISHDINQPLTEDIPSVDYLIHAASNTHPVAYAMDPIGTITTNVIGTYNLLEHARKNAECRFLFASSVEVYGENKGDIEYFDESYCGYIDCNTLRAGYPESKRTGEALCQAYIDCYNMNIVTARLSRTYGPTMLRSDTKAISQFIKNGAKGEEIILKSEGSQLYSYNYVADSVSGLLTVLLCGECGEAYNIADKKSDITLRDLAQLIADYVGTKIVFEIPNKTEQAGYSKATKALLDSSKLRKLGWEAHWSIEEGIKETLDYLMKI